MTFLQVCAWERDCGVECELHASFLKETPCCSPQWLRQFTSSSAVREGCLFPTPSPALVICGLKTNFLNLCLQRLQKTHNSRNTVLLMCKRSTLKAKHFLDKLRRQINEAIRFVLGNSTSRGLFSPHMPLYQIQPFRNSREFLLMENGRLIKLDV